MNLAELKAKIIAKKKEKKSNQGVVKQPPDVKDSRLTPIQEDTLLKTISEGKSSYYHFIVHFEGLLDEKTLVTAINKVIEKQLALRTSFYKDGSVWKQKIDLFNYLDIQISDLSEMLIEASNLKSNEITKNLAESPLKLLEGELYRLHLIKINETNHRLVAVISHLCCDFSSLGILNYEVVSFYQQLLSGSVPIIDPQAINYLDFTKWVEKNSADDKYTEKLNFWGNYLESSEPLRLGNKKSKNNIANQDINVEHDFLNISNSLKEKIEDLIGRHQFTLLAICLTIFVLLLSRKTGQKKITLEIPTNGRDRPELENLIGAFADLFIFYIEIDYELTFLELLEQIRNNILHCFTNQNISFQEIVKAFPKTYKDESEETAEIVFSVNNVHQDEFNVTGLKIWTEMLDTHQATADMTFIIYSGQELIISTEYKKTVFNTEMVKAMQEEYCQFLSKYLDNPNLKIRKTLEIYD